MVGWGEKRIVSFISGRTSALELSFLASEKHSADKSVVNKVTSSVEMLRTGKFKV